MESTWPDKATGAGGSPPAASRPVTGGPPPPVARAPDEAGGARGLPAAEARLLAMLQRQREALERYLELLELEGEAIRMEDVDRLESYVQMERLRLEEIGALRRVIVPLEELCAGSRAADAVPPPAPALEEVRRALARLRGQAAASSRGNCRLLAERMESLARRIRRIARPRPPASPYARPADPALVDISL